MLDLFSGPSAEVRTTLHHLEHRLKELEKHMALNFANLQAAVATLTADVKSLMALVPVAGADASNQATIDAVTASLSSLDAAVKTAEAPAPAAAPAAPTGATGSTAA